MKTLLAALLLGTTLTACSARPQFIAMPASEPAVKEPGSMSVTGQATLEVSPDCADLTITISADDPRPGLAAKALDAKKQALIAGLAAQGTLGTDVKLSNLQLNPIYDPSPEGWSTLKIRTYRAELTITATTRDFGKIATLLDTAATAGASVMSTAFRRSDMPELKKQVRDMALKAAQAKAQQTATTLGIPLGRIKTVAEAQGGYMWNQTYFPQVSNSAAASNSSGSELGGTLQPLTLDVTIEFELAT